MNISLIGMGAGAPGTRDTLLFGALPFLDGAALAVGAPRLLAALPPNPAQRRVAAVRAEDIAAALQEAANCQTAAVLFSGDTGFYSGCRTLLPVLAQAGFAESEIRVFPGVSSVQLLAAALRRPWQGWRLVSAHGTACDPVREVMQGAPTLFLTDGTNTPAALCARLRDAGLGDLPVTVGENLTGGPREAVTAGTAAQLAGRAFAPLSVLLAEAAPTPPRRTPGWPDEWFARAEVPMTKRYVRAAALAALAPAPGETAWDVGAGTGSVSVELAAAVGGAPVYAVECRPEACALTRQNRAALHAWNLTVVEDRAPQALETLPAPDVVFIGGSKGELVGIVRAALAKNPRARVCAAAIALETLAAAREAFAACGVQPQAVQLAVSQTRAAGGLHLLTANNPVFLVTGNCE